ncbi:hypothetical protein MBLNU457_5085t2 [Dothideomycetes sp. NU457]
MSAPAMPEPTARRRTNPLHSTDTSSHHYAPSQMSNRSSRNQPWDTSSLGRRGSVSSLQSTRTGPPYVSDASYQPAVPKMPRHMPYAPSPAPSSQDSRSYSMTQPYHRGLTMQRSVSSLRSQNTAPAMPPRAQYLYPARLKRPGYRSASPALSDYSNVQPSSLPPPGRHVHRPPLTSYHSDYNHGPPMPIRQYPPPMPQYYRQPMPGPPPAAYDDGGYQYQMPPPRRAQPYPMAYHAHPQMPAMPPRVYTPRAQSTPPSSDPSSSAPQSSNPPTPRDADTAQITIEPAFIDPALSDLGDDSEDLAAYAQYADELEKSTDKFFELDAQSQAIHELEAPVAPRLSQVPRSEGFVQRIKALLNERAAVANEPTIKVTVQTDPTPTTTTLPQAHSNPDIAELPPDPIEVPQRRSTINQHPEDRHEPKQELQPRITKEMVRSIMASPSSSEQGTVTVEMQQSPTTSASQSVVSEEDHVHSSEYPVENNHLGEIEQHEPDTSDNKPIEPVQFTPITSALQDVQAAGDNTIRPTGDGAKLSVTHQNDDAPISPLKPDEAVINDSVVSPATTESPHKSSKSSICIPESNDVPISDAAVVSDRVAEPHAPPAQASTVAVDIPLSVPTVTTDVVTDIAVRFSLPRRSDHGKAQLVRVANNIQEEASQEEVELHKDVFELPTSMTPRHSGVDQVAPLNIKKAEILIEKTVQRNSTDATDLSSFIRRSFPRRQSIWPSDLNGSRRSSFDTASDSRQSAPHNAPGHLPRLKEDSQEDMLHHAGLRSTDFKFPVSKAQQSSTKDEPLRPLASCPTQPKVAKKEPKPAVQPLGPAPSGSALPGMSLSEIRSLPSLNFSRLDLVGQLNGALDLETRALTNHYKRPRTPAEIACPSPLRPSSTEALRERYTSFFVKPEEFKVPSPVEETESISVDNILSGHAAAQKVVGVNESTHQREASRASKRVMSPTSRPLSPEQLLGVAAEVDQLSVPTVHGLSERLSQLLPSLRHLHLDSIIADDQAVEHAIEEIHHIGERPQSLCTVRSSLGLRSLAAVAEDIATNGTHDSTLSMSTQLKRMTLTAGKDAEQGVTGSGAESKSVHSGDESTSSSGPTTPKRALLRTMSEGRRAELRPARASIGGATSHSKRSLTISGQTTRPWNLDENYPWSNDTIDIGLPALAHCRESLASDLLRHTARNSTASATGFDQTLQSASSTLSSISGLDPTVTVTADTMTNTKNMLKIKSKKPSTIFGSLRRKASRLRGRPSDVVEQTATDLTLSAHNPGDRYPSTALTAPLPFELDEVRSFFSDDSSGRVSPRRESRRGSLRKHLSSLRMRLPPVITISRPFSDIQAEAEAMNGNLRSRSLDRFGRASCQSGLRVVTSGMEADGGDSPPSPLTASSGFNSTFGGGGMGKVEFRTKRVVERLKTMWARGGALLRALSGRGRKRRDVERDGRDSEDELHVWDDSVYSGT